jgi:hypothetical protein
MLTRISRAALTTAAIVGAIATRDASAAIQAEYAWNLADTTGALRTSGVSLSWDRHGKELFLVDGGIVRVFSPTGMEIFSFGDDAGLGHVISVAAMEDGDLLLLTMRGDELSVMRSNFRGEPLGKVELTGVPAEIARDFRPNSIAYAAGKAFLLDKRGMRLVVTDLSGAHVASYDLSDMIVAAEQLEGEQRRDEAAVTRDSTGIRGFSVDGSGNVLFTVQPMFRAYVLSPEGKLQGFGKKGSAQGKFNIVGPIAADEQGNLYVGDLLRSVVIVFDKEFRFVREIGGRGTKPGSLLVPSELAVGDGKVFVSQYARRGVSVFKVTDAPATDAG